jgi:hypothetical protein
MQPSDMTVVIYCLIAPKHISLQTQQNLSNNYRNTPASISAKVFTPPVYPAQPITSASTVVFLDLAGFKNHLVTTINYAEANTKLPAM